jgi:hypothetical protein
MGSRGRATPLVPLVSGWLALVGGFAGPAGRRPRRSSGRTLVLPLGRAHPLRPREVPHGRVRVARRDRRRRTGTVARRWLRPRVPRARLAASTSPARASDGSPPPTTGSSRGSCTWRGTVRITPSSSTPWSPAPTDGRASASSSFDGRRSRCATPGSSARRGGARLERMRPRDCGCPPEQRPCPRRAPRTRWSRCVGATRERAGDQGRGQHLHDGVDHRREGDLFGQAGGEHDDRGDAELLLGDGEQHR